MGQIGRSMVLQHYLHVVQELEPWQQAAGARQNVLQGGALHCVMQ